MEVIKFILNEFEDYDRHNPSVLFISFKMKEYELFEFLMSKYPNEYTMKYICDKLKKAARKWDNKSGAREFINKIESYCLKSICFTTEDREMLNECVIKLYKKFRFSSM